MREWWETFFDDPYYAKFYGVKADPARTNREVEGVIKLLNLQPGSRVLDIGCGWGRHCAGLTSRGIRADGLDYSAHMIALAREHSAAGGSEYFHADFRNMPCDSNSYDAVICMYTSFGFYERQEDDLVALNEVARILRPGGRFLIQKGHPFQRAGKQQQFVVSEDGEHILLEDEHIDYLSGRVKRTWRVYQLGKLVYERDDISWHLYTPWEMSDLLSRAGLNVQGAYGDWDSSSQFGHNSARLIVLARKTPQDIYERSK